MAVYITLSCNLLIWHGAVDIWVVAVVRGRDGDQSQFNLLWEGIVFSSVVMEMGCLSLTQ